MAIRHLEQAYAVATNPQVREQVKAKLFVLRGQRMSQKLEESLKAFERMVGDRVPGSPEAFGLVVGPRTTALGVLSSPAAPAAGSPPP
jgi:hypothetical protein